jgi:RNA polymerase sigma-70 factor (ECF subfamily)
LPATCGSTCAALRPKASAQNSTTSRPEAPTEDLAPEAELILRQNLDRVHQALLALPANQREVVVLRFFSEMTLEEIAHTVGEGFETVKSRLRYAFTRLRRELEAQA